MTAYDVGKHLRLANMAICLTIHNSCKCSGREGFKSTGELSAPSIPTETDMFWSEWDCAAWVPLEAFHHQSLGTSISKQKRGVQVLCVHVSDD